MRKITINLDDKDFDALSKVSQKKGIQPESFVSQIVHKSLVSHTIDYEDMAKGYESMADINLELSGGKKEK